MKAEMQRRRKAIDAEIKQLEKELEASGGYDDSLGYRIQHLESLKIRYMLTVYSPAKLKNGLVINEKLLNAFLKKLPTRSGVVMGVSKEALTLSYSTVKSGSGRFLMHDLSSYYVGMDLPEREGVLSEDRRFII